MPAQIIVPSKFGIDGLKELLRKTTNKPIGSVARAGRRQTNKHDEIVMRIFLARKI
jgi:hypothetical protein